MARPSHTQQFASSPSANTTPGCSSLGNNLLNGTLPDNWAEMPGLVILALPSNQLTGTLPNSWGYDGSWPKLMRM